MILITMTVRAFRFYDQEKIYVDPTNYYPIIVERDLNLWGKKERIIEKYDHNKNLLRIIKETDKEKTESVIVKKGPIDNIYSFLYRYRQNGEFQEGEKIVLNLPTKEIQIKLVENTHIKVGRIKQDAFLFKSSPKRMKIWFGTTEEHWPLRIDGALGFGKTSLILRSTSKGKIR